MIDCARKHILHLCQQLNKSRQHVFGSIVGDSFETNNYFLPDLLKMKYDSTKSGGRDERLIEDGEHFGYWKIITEITGDTSAAENFLIEVCFSSFFKFF